MNISINTNINLFKNNIAEIINTSQLPVSIVYFVLKDVLNEVSEVYKNTLEKEAENIQKEIEKQEKDDVAEHQE